MFDIDYDMEWEREMERDEFRKPRPFRCCDGLCGQLDCARCYPENEIIDLLN